MKKLFIALLFWGVSSVYAQTPGTVINEQAFEKNLNIIHSHVEQGISDGKIPGAEVLVAYNGKIVHFEATGMADIENHKLLTAETIFRLASMSKPITAAGILVLVDEGKIKLSDPLSKYIPEYKNMRVAVENTKDYKPDPNAPTGTVSAVPLNYHTVPADREITIKDILTHSCGITQGSVGLTEADKIPHHPNENLAEIIPRFAAVPLDFQPGTHTGYTFLVGFDLLGRVIEVASGQPLDKFLEKNIFKPCDMKNTGFAVHESLYKKIPVLYKETANGLVISKGVPQKAGLFATIGDPRPWFIDSVYFSGAGGMIGTIGDYYRFAQMLANGGSYKGRRILSREIVDQMSSPELPDTIKGFGKGQTWGLGVRVITSDTGVGAPLTIGCFGWSGAYGTHFWIDPQRKIIAIYMANVENLGGAGAYTAKELEHDVMDALKKQGN